MTEGTWMAFCLKHRKFTGLFDPRRESFYRPGEQCECPDERLLICHVDHQQQVADLFDDLNAQENFFDMVSQHPFRWALYPEPDGIVTIEYFGESYSGDLEKGTGQWQVSGPFIGAIKQVLEMKW